MSPLDKRITGRQPAKTGHYASYLNGAGAIRNLSQSGVFIEDTNPVEEGAKFTFNLHLGPDTLECEGIVRRSIPREGMGVEFLKISRDGRMRLEKYIIAMAKAKTARS